MIIATALGALFNSMTIQYNDADVVVNYHYGDQKELNAWIKNMTSGGVRKYPLVWYILNDFTELNGWYETEARVIVFQNTMSEWFNPKRQEESYTKIIEPVTKEIEKRLTQSGYVEIPSRDLKTRFIKKDEPNYGVDTNNENLTSSDFKSTKSYGTQSIATDIVDARLIRFPLRIKAECLIQ